MEASAVERKVVTALFADLVGFTALAERLDAEDVATVQAAYFETVRETISRYGGRLEKFIGDAAMAVFGAPHARDDDAERAVRAGLVLASGVEQLGARVGLDADALRLRVGVNTGEVIQSPDRGTDEALVTGDAVNVAARLQAAAAPGEVLVGETTALSVAEAIELEAVGPVELKGKAAAVRAWHVAGVRPQRSRDHAMGSLRAPLLGREDELLQLIELLAQAREGRALRIVVVAPPGVGKTRLVDEFAARAGPRVLRARLRPDVLAPFDAVAQLLLDALAGGDLAALRAALRDAETSSARADGILEAAEVLLRVGGVSPATGAGDAGAGREARFAAWLDALGALGGDDVSTWVVEDAHWAGGDLLAFLAFATHERARVGRLLLVTARPSLLETAPMWCGENADSVSLLHLPPLSTARAADLIYELVGHALDDELVTRVVEHSDGNPLFVEELLRTWISVGTLVPANGGWALTQAPREVPLPATVQAIYGAQLDDLPASARMVARRASVAGRRFPLAALPELGVADSAEGVQLLERRALVSGPWSEPLFGRTYSYRHALLRDAGYASLARADRARLHVSYARWLERAAPDGPGRAAELIGRHYARALESVPALAQEVAAGVDRAEAARLAAAWFERGAEAALEGAAHDTTRSLLARALELTAEDALLDQARRRLLLGRVTASSADMDEGRVELEHALEVFRAASAAARSSAERGPARAGISESAAALGWILNQQVQFESGARLAEDVLAEIGESDDVETARLLLLRAVSILSGTDDHERPAADAKRALAIARAAGDGDLELEALRMAATVRTEGGLAAADEWQEVERLARSRRRWDLAAGAIRTRAALLIDDRAVEALPLLETTAELCGARRLNESLAWTEYARAETGFVSGDWKRALECGRAALELGRRNAYDRAVVRTWFVVLPVAAARGEQVLIEDGHRWFVEKLGPPQNPSPYARMMRAAMDLIFAQAGLQSQYVPNVEERMPSFDLDHGGPSWLAAVESVVESWLAAGEVSGVTQALERMRERLAAHPQPSSLARSTEALLRGRLLAAKGQQPAAAEEGRRALAGFRVSRAPWWIAKAIRLQEATGQASSRELEEAREIERTLGIPSL